MPTLPAARYHEEIIDSTAALAALLDQAGPELAVPSCPGWDLRKLAAHVGRVHRWAAETVATRSASEVEFRAVPDGRLPDDPAARGHWLTSGAERAIEVISAAGDAPVWAFGMLRPATFWSRRMAHETMVHRADAQLAAGQQAIMAPSLAADAIDEWLTIMSGPVDGSTDPRAGALPTGRSIRFGATDPDLPVADWLVTHDADGVRVESGTGTGTGTSTGTADAAVRGPAADLLLMLLGRQAPGATRVRVDGDGDAAVFAHWLSQTSF
ncbi:MAG: maleylpyruvate isomerase family mycothiol-dependent enzyme [Streptosporangiaceae bacterium]